MRLGTRQLLSEGIVMELQHRLCARPILKAKPLAERSPTHKYSEHQRLVAYYWLACGEASGDAKLLAKLNKATPTVSVLRHTLGALRICIPIPTAA